MAHQRHGVSLTTGQGRRRRRSRSPLRKASSSDTSSDPLQWIHRCECYFCTYRILENRRVAYATFHLLDSAQCGTIGSLNGPPTWEQLVLLIAACFGPQIMLGGGSSADDMKGDSNNLVTDGGTLFMGNNNGREEPRVGPHDLDVSDARDIEVGDGWHNSPTQEGGYGSDGSAVLAGTNVILPAEAAASQAQEFAQPVGAHRAAMVRALTMAPGAAAARPFCVRIEASSTSARTILAQTALKSCQRRRLRV
jgi:hypothetical protein